MINVILPGTGNSEAERANYDEPICYCIKCDSPEGDDYLGGMCRDCYNARPCPECGGKLDTRMGHFNFLRFCGCGTIYIIGKDGSIEHLTDLDTIREEDEPSRESIEEVIRV